MQNRPPNVFTQGCRSLDITQAVIHAHAEPKVLQSCDLSLFVARVEIVRRREELLLEQSWAGEAEHGVRRSSFVIRSTCTATTEALLSDECSSGLAV